MGSSSFLLPASAVASGMKRRLAVHTAVSLGEKIPPTWPLPLPPPFPRNKGKQVLLLDIDETLIHTFGMANYNPKKENQEGSKKVDSLLDGVHLEKFYYLARPFLGEFLKEVNELFEVIFWTSGIASYCSAIISSFEQDILHLPPSFYSYREVIKEIKGLSGENKSSSTANFYSLSRSQTLERLQYMKYIPMIGRPINSSVLIDDNVRSFPLTPRSGIKIKPFYPTSEDATHYLYAAQKVDQLRSESKPIDDYLLQLVEAGHPEIAALEKDTALLDILPMLRAIAKVPYGEDVRLELDYWRQPSYVDCDDFRQNMDLRSVVRQQLLGACVETRQSKPIPPLKSHLYNASYIEECCAEVSLLHRRPFNRSKL